MNPRDEMEVRLTALLLGELSAEEAAEVQAQLSADPALAALHARLSQALGLLREASAFTENSASAPPPKLSAERRERLLAHFQTRTPAPIAATPGWNWREFVPLSLAAMLIAMLGGTLLVPQCAVRERASRFAAQDPRGASRRVLAGEDVSGIADLRSPDMVNLDVPSSESSARETDSKFFAMNVGVGKEAGSAGGGGSGIAAPSLPTVAALTKSGSGSFILPTPDLPISAPLPTGAPAAGAAATANPEPSVTLATARPGPKPTPTAAAPARFAGGKRAPSPKAPGVSISLGDKFVTLNSSSATAASGAISAAPAVTAPTINELLFDADGMAKVAEPRLKSKIAENRGAIGGREEAKPMLDQSAVTPAEKPMAGALKSENTFTGSTTVNGGTLAFDARPLAWRGNIEKQLPAISPDQPTDSSNAVEVAKGAKFENQLGRVADLGAFKKQAAANSDYFNEPSSPQLRTTVDGGKNLADAENSYNLAVRENKEKVDQARNVDEVTASRGTRSRSLEKSEMAMTTPAQSLTQPAAMVVEAASAESSRTELISRKLERIIIPKIEFKEATIQEAVEFLREKSRSLDTTEPNPANRGVNFVLNLDGAGASPAPADAAPIVPAIPGFEALPGAAPAPSIGQSNPADSRITVSLTNIPLVEAVRYVTSLAGLKFKKEPFAVSIVPASVNTDSVITKEYTVRPDLLTLGAAPGAGDAARGGSGIAKGEAAKEWLTSLGVTFGPGGSAIYIPWSNKLIVRNTEEQLDLLETIISAAESSEVPPEKPKDEVPAHPASDAPVPQPEVPAEKPKNEDTVPPQPALEVPVPQPEVETKTNAFSTFSLNVSDVAFKLAAASLEQGKMPEPATVRSEEFINAFDYRDPEPAAGVPLAFASERARYPFAQNRDLLRLSVKTAAAGRQPGRALNIVLLIDNSGSMERADRVRILQEALRVLSEQLQPQDKLSVVTFARTPRLWADGVAGDKAGEVTARVSEITPQGGTDISAALDLGYTTALRHYQVGNINRVVLLTDGAANLGDVNPEALKQKVEAHRKQGIALDCFGIGWEGLNDDLLEQLSRNGDGRYGFINTPEEAATEFAGQLAGALRVAASDVKVQVEFNPRRVAAYRQIGYAKHQLTKEQFRDNTVDAAEIGAAESGNALYVVEVNPRGEGDLATVRVRFKVPGTEDYREHEWTVPFDCNAGPLEQASPALRLAGTASAFSEWLVASPYAAEVIPDRLLGLLNGVPAIYGADPRPQKLEWMIRTAKSVSRR